MYKTILFAQSRSPLEKSTMVVNGDVFEADSMNDDLQQAFDYLVGFNSQMNINNLSSLSIHTLQKIQHSLFRIEKWFRRNEISSPSQLDFRKSGKGIFIKSAYTDMDENDRKMQFMFYANTQEETEACEWLKESSSKIGRHLNEADLDAIFEALAAVCGPPKALDMDRLNSITSRLNPEFTVGEVGARLNCSFQADDGGRGADLARRGARVSRSGEGQGSISEYRG